jgi:hypothetical protein
VLTNFLPTRRRAGGRALVVALAAAPLLTACADAPLAPTPEAAETAPPPQLATAANISWWHGLTVAQRGALIEAEAKRWVGATSSQLSNYYRCDCKEFSRYMVKRASREVEYLTPTVDADGDSYWKGWRLRTNSHVVWVTNYLSGSIGLAKPGYVVQAHNNNGGPHSMIISWVSSDSVRVVDANWGGCGVRVRTMTRSKFRYYYPKWSLYKII